QLNDPALRAARFAAWQSAESRLQAALNEIAKSPTTREEQQLLHQCQALHANYRHHFSQLAAQVQSGELTPLEATATVEASFEQASYDLALRAEELADANFREMTSGMDSMASRLSLCMLVVCGLMAAILG